MTNRSVKENIDFKRIATIVEDLIQDNTLYKERLDKNEMFNHIYNLFDVAVTTPDINTISQDELIEIIDSILVVEAVAGTLNDLTTEEMQLFEEAIV